MQKKLVWLDINSSYSHSSLALPALDSSRTGDDYLWSKVSGTINSDIFALTESLHSSAPDLIAGTLWLFNHNIMIEICQRIKTLLPRVTIILGGPEFNGDNEDFLRRNPFVDYCFRGEGESEFPKFLLGEKLNKINGLCYISPQNEYVDNGHARVSDFTKLPAPENSDFFEFSSPFVQLECSRGCFNTCSFCVSGGDKPIRIKPITEIEKRIEYIASQGIKDVRILDRTFNYSAHRAEQMLGLFTKFPDMNFHLEIHPALLTDQLLALLETMPKGLVHLETGMQSLNDRVIESCTRIGSCQDALRGLTRLCAMDNFETHADLIAGLPHYTLEEIFKDVRTLSSINAGEIQLELLKLLPGTALREQGLALGIKYSLLPPYEVLQTPDITLSELNSARLLSKLLDKFYNAKAWQEVTRELINHDENFLSEFLFYLSPMELLDKPLSLERRGSLLYSFCKSTGRNLDSISISWIKNGLSLRKEEAGKITKLSELPETMEHIANAHYYLWQGNNGQYIICYDRAKNHSLPELFSL